MEITPRDEVRVSGFGLLRCPSCRELAAELLGRHNLVLMHRNVRMVSDTWMGLRIVQLETDKPWCECRDGVKAELDGWEMWEAAANISLADAVWFNENRMYAKMGIPLWNWQEKQ